MVGETKHLKDINSFDLKEKCKHAFDLYAYMHTSALNSCCLEHSTTKKKKKKKKKNFDRKF